MNLNLPAYQESYSSRITQEAYSELLTKSQNLLDRALLIYEKYCDSGGENLYPLFWNTLLELRPNINALAVVAWSELDKMSMRLKIAADATSWENGMRPTYLWDIVGCIKPD